MKFPNVLPSTSIRFFGALLATLTIGFGTPSQASMIIFQDDFSDNDLSNWSFTSGQTWSVVGGALQTNRVAAGFEFASMVGISTPEQFRLEVDVKNLSGASNKPSDQGHGGAFWDQSSGENKTYVRTHNNELNLYAIPGVGETHDPIVADNGDTIRYILDVDYFTQQLDITAEVIAGNASNIGNSAHISLSGSAFDARVLNPNSGGGIGLLTWGDSVSFDNVTLYAVPEPLSLTLFAAGLVGMGIVRRRKQTA
jgi:hypothetical protein